MSEEIPFLKLGYLCKRLNYGPVFSDDEHIPAFRSIYKWDMRFLEMAKLVSTWSKDPSTQTGAVIVDSKGSIVSLGYNGFARGVEDTPERWNDRDTKYKMVVHCERNAIIFAKKDLTGCTLYTWPFMSCSPCAGMVIQAGIVRVVAPENDNPRWQADFELAKQQFAEAKVIVDLIPGLL